MKSVYVGVLSIIVITIICLLSHACQMSHQSHRPCFDHPKNICRAALPPGVYPLAVNKHYFYIIIIIIIIIIIRNKNI